MNHPYAEFETTSVWKALNKAVADLEKNQDIKLKTTQQHIVGYICQQLFAQKLVLEGSAKKK